MNQTRIVFKPSKIVTDLYAELTCPPFLPAVSTLEQNTENQLWEIEAAGVAIKPWRPQCLVMVAEQPGFMQLRNRMENGDVLIVTKLDCLERNARNIRKTAELLAISDIRVHCLASRVNLTLHARLFSELKKEGRMRMFLHERLINFLLICPWQKQLTQYL